MKVIDLRSDTVTKPSLEMRRAMAAAEVGDDVYGEDPTVNRLEALTAEMSGTEAALFVPSGTQGNLLALLAHCQRGDEYIAGQQAHNYRYEAGGAAVVGGIQPQPLEFSADGSLDLTLVEQFIKPADSHFARTRLLSLENTQAGKALSPQYLSAAREFADRHQLGLHLDGARAFNAAVFHKQSIADVVRPFDTASLCLSKGLGAPVGSVLCGKKELLADARRWRKMLGGGMRQAGVLAAAGIYALEKNIEGLQRDHEHAELLAEKLKQVPGLAVRREENQTNMVFLDMPIETAEKLKAHLAGKQIHIGTGQTVRLVTHLDLSMDDIERAAREMIEFFAKGKK
ncbi:L-threonine aldolase [Malonomonas rubra DSM 5091]|uniref:L-threonine aldolase n=1 Tax=Malonomonas rubra DSM 5091 TaxID=1122189 RepID=A0A1M6GR55_MALRU|nr:low-specificity L-threonine aldolase [Malonomonas rubra]SHJ12435.1 L-threonine aldolase [Malonomonas rubra DSM 5091]